MASLSLAIRRFREGRAAVLGLVVLVLVTAACAAAAPRVFDRFADDALRGEVTNATPFQRNIQLVEESFITSGDPGDRMSRVAAEGETLEQRIPDRVRGLFRDRSFLAETIRWAVQEDTNDPGFVRLRVQQDVDDHVTFVEGRPPTDATRRVRLPVPLPADGVPKEVDTTVLEVALSVESLQRIGLSVGDRWVLEPDTNDRLVGRSSDLLPGAIDVVGAFEPNDPDEEYWLDDTALIRPSIHRSGDRDFVYMTAMIDPEAYDELIASTASSRYPIHYAWRYFTDVDKLQSEQLPAVVADLRRLDGTFSSASGPVIEGTLLQSGLLPLLESVQARWASVASVLAVVGLGPAAVGIAALALVGVLVMQRRRASLALGRARGASAGQLIGAVGLEGLVISLPPAILAAGLAFLFLPAGPWRPTIAAAVAVALVTTIVLVAAGAPTAVSSPRGPGRDAPVVRRPSPRRLLMEALVVGLAILGAYLLRERGVSGASSATALTGVDPFIALVPALVGLAAGIVAVRLLPVALLGVSRLAALRRDLVPSLALRRVTRGGSGAAILIVLMATATIGTFAGAMLVHLDRASEAVAWEEVGAPYRISAPAPLPVSFDPSALPGVDAVAGEYEVSSLVQERFLPLQFLAVDAAQYEEVIAGAEADVHLPPEMVTPTVAAGQPVPAIVTHQLTEGAKGIGVGGTFNLVVEGFPVTFRVIEVRDSWPGMAPNQAWVLASRDQLRALRGGNGLRTSTAAYLRAPASAGPELRAAVLKAVPDADVESRADRIAAIEDSPMTRGLVAGVGVAALVAFLYAALAVAAALALTGASRAVETAHLRTLGLSRREATGLVIVEHGPTIIVAFVVGVALGVGLFALLRDGLGLASLVGAPIVVDVGVDPIQLGVVLLAIVIIVSLGIGLGAALQRSAAPVAAVRRGFE
ncbi:MAG TPA: FtsX-like permease family protein [Candidatus Limnocylindrales bacterium]|nr:FtsX-like permease family protein [Candidatus Limnocylindrales bacterium]